jgi:tropomodulin
MEITALVEQNPTLLRLGLHLEYNDARHRIAMHLQRNIDRSKYLSLFLYVVTSIANIWD